MAFLKQYLLLLCCVSFLLVSASFLSRLLPCLVQEVEASFCHFKFHLQPFFWVLSYLWHIRQNAACYVVAAGRIESLWGLQAMHFCAGTCMQKSILIKTMTSSSDSFERLYVTLLDLLFIVLIMNDSVCIFSCSVQVHVFLETLNKSHVLSVHFSSPQIGMYVRKLILKILLLQFMAYVAVFGIFCKIST